MNINGRKVEATTSTPVFAVDTEGKISAWNQGAEYCLGYRCSQVLGRRCWEVLQGREPSCNRFCDETCAVLRMALEGEPIHGRQMFFRNASGETMHVSMSTLVVRGENGKEVAHLLKSL